MATSNMVTIKKYGKQSVDGRTVYIDWAWSKYTQTDHYRVEWYYYVKGNSTKFIGTKEDVAWYTTISTWDAPANATTVKVRIKPVAKKHKQNGKQVSYWTGNWTSYRTLTFDNALPTAAPTPTVTLDGLKLKCSVDYDPSQSYHQTYVRFYVYKKYRLINTSSKIMITNKHAAWTCNVEAGGPYQVRCKGIRSDGTESDDWSNYGVAGDTIPGDVRGITVIKATSATSVHLEWDAVPEADKYTIEYTTDKSYFDSGGAVSSSTSTVTHAEVGGLESGKEWFFRVRASNEAGDSEWTEIRSLNIGKKPAAPTTYSSTTTGTPGEKLTLYWVHNSEDGSSQTFAELELTINGSTTTKTIANTTDEDEKDKTSSYILDTSLYDAGAKILWRVRTKGIMDEYSEWSIQRAIDIYAPPTLDLKITNLAGEIIAVVQSFPFYILGYAGPPTQKPIGFGIDILSTESYTTTDDLGNETHISDGDIIYSKYFNSIVDLRLEMNPRNIDLENGIMYTVKCTVTMDTGLSTEVQSDFLVDWAEEQYEPNAEIGYDEDTITSYIMPYCYTYPVNKRKILKKYTGYVVTEEPVDDTVVGTIVPGTSTTTGEEVYKYTGLDGLPAYYAEVLGEGVPIPGITLDVYRREFDGSFTEIGSNIVNGSNTFLTDPHPSLDFARYRIVARSDATGSLSYTDLPGYPIGVTSVVIQWDETWNSFEAVNEDPYAEPQWHGSLLRLPYNIDVSEETRKDVELVEYIGRKNPVSYHGTQIGTGATINADVPKSDKETLYSLRRLSAWMGNVYVREPSGIGYWANINVSFSQKHRDLIIPINIQIARVEGGA